MFRYICLFILYFLATTNNLNLIYIGDTAPYINIRNSYFIEYFKPLSNTINVPLSNKVNIFDFEFQDARYAKVYKSSSYKVWSYKNIYKEYINKVNESISLYSEKN